MKISIISGARPQFIKIAPLIKQFLLRNVVIHHIHSGQHYDNNMSDQIFIDLGMNPPDINLNVGSGSHAAQTGKMMIQIEKELLQERPNYVMVVGDTNSTLAGALASIKIQIPVIHLESGLRSFDWKMPEEINRIIVDKISSLLITSTSKAVENLVQEGVNKENIFLTGDIMVDSIKSGLNRLKSTKIKYHEPYFLATIHRQENVDNYENCKKILDLFIRSPVKIIFPIHPRAVKQFKEFELYNKLEKIENLEIIPPQGYLDFLSLHKNAIGVLTDSGGLQKEAFILRKPCITLRTTTEWVETLSSGANRLLGLDIDRIIESMKDIISKKFVVEEVHPYGDGSASTIVDHIMQLDMKGMIKIPSV